MFTTRPFAASTSGRSSRVTLTRPNTLTSKCQRQSSSVTVSIGPPCATPALLTMPSRPLLPSSSRSCVTRAAMWSLLVTSSITGRTSPAIPFTRSSPSRLLADPGVDGPPLRSHPLDARPPDPRRRTRDHNRLRHASLPAQGEAPIIAGPREPRSRTLVRVRQSRGRPRWSAWPSGPTTCADGSHHGLLGEHAGRADAGVPGRR